MGPCRSSVFLWEPFSFLTCDELLGELYIGECVYVVNCVHDLRGYSEMGDGLIEPGAPEEVEV